MAPHEIAYRWSLVAPWPQPRSDASIGPHITPLLDSVFCNTAGAGRASALETGVNDTRTRTTTAALEIACSAWCRKACVALCCYVTEGSPGWVVQYYLYIYVRRTFRVYLTYGFALFINTISTRAFQILRILKISDAFKIFNF